MNKLDQQEFDTAEELVNAVQKHFGVDVKVDNQQHQKCIWLCGSTGKKIIGITYFFSRGMWTIGGQIWTPDFTIDPVPEQESQETRNKRIVKLMTL